MAVVSSQRIAPDAVTVSQRLGLIADLAGTWEGEGFNLIARPDHVDGTPLYLQLNQTHETLQVEPIGSAIPNRGFGMDDIELHGLSYLQKIRDAATGGALHLEPGLWVTQPPTTFPALSPPAGGQIVARMGSIPHGNAILMSGSVSRFDGPPAVTGAEPYAFSVFPSFNSTPFAATPPLIVNAAGSSEKATVAALPAPTPAPFPEYDLTVADGLGAGGVTNTRTPFGTGEPALAAEIDGVAMQDVINDPVTLLQARIQRQIDRGDAFEGAVINIASQSAVTFRTTRDAPTGDTTVVTVSDGGGGVENIQFLTGEPPADGGPNALTSLVYATFWITTVIPEHAPRFLQLQYAQMTVLNFGVLGAPAGAILGWPHVSVATLRKSFA